MKHVGEFRHTIYMRILCWCLYRYYCFGSQLRILVSLLSWRLHIGSTLKHKIKAILGKKACMRKVTAGRENIMHACMEDLMTVGLGFW
jgi:hypothetical protein